MPPLYYTTCTKYFPALLILHTVVPIASVRHKACTQYFPLLLCTTWLPQSTSRYIPVLLHITSLRKKLASTTSYYKGCTKYRPVLLCTTTKVAQRTSQYHFVLPSTRKVAQSKHFPKLLCTAEVGPSTSLCCFVPPQRSHIILPNTTLYFKGCAKYFPKLICTTTKVARSTLQPVLLHTAKVA